MPELVRPPVNLLVTAITHCSCDYELVEDTRVLCNPRGYGPADLNERLNQYLVIELCYARHGADRRHPRCF